MENPKIWKAGKADEAWKIMVCARDAERAKDLILGVAYILDNPGHVSLDESADVLRRFTGAQIADALIAYRNSAMLSVANAIGTRETVSA